MSHSFALQINENETGRIKNNH